jgi:hypothetical protein
MMAAGSVSAAVIGHKSASAALLPWECLPHPSANAGAETAAVKNAMTANDTTIFFITPP